MYKGFNTYLLALILSVLTFTGCDHDDLVGGPERPGNTLLLRLGLSVPSGYTRAEGGPTHNPTGGEHGDGWRLGQCNENTVYDVYLYKYSHKDGINAPDGTPVTLLAFQKEVNFIPTAENIDNGNGFISVAIELNVGDYVWKAAGYDHFIACINTKSFGASTTLGQLRNALVTSTCLPGRTGMMKDYDHFTMANAKDSYVLDGGSGSKENPFIVEVDLERTVARIDFAYSTAAQTAGNFSIDNGEYHYKVLKTDGTPAGDDVYVTHVRAANVMQNAPYLIKRSAATGSDTPTYLAVEQNPADKYVVEPTTWTKTLAAAQDLNYNVWFSDSWYKNAHNAHSYNANATTSWFREQDKVHCAGNDEEHNAFTDGTTLDEVDRDWQYYVLDYANENTMMADQTHHLYTTGLVLKATYKPEHVYSDENLTEATYTYGTTFWRWHDINTNADKFFTTQAAAEAYNPAGSHPVVFEYKDAQCYYNVWLRHENIVNDPTTTMMEFGIVRNNIYRVCVEFTGIGMPEVPDDMVTPENVRMYIFVRKWNLIEHKPIEI